jgi:uncharacterized protein (DUF1015 family)
MKAIQYSLIPCITLHNMLSVGNIILRNLTLEQQESSLESILSQYKGIYLLYKAYNKI